MHNIWGIKLEWYFVSRAEADPDTRKFLCNMLPRGEDQAATFGKVQDALGDMAWDYELGMKVPVINPNYLWYGPPCVDASVRNPKHATPENRTAIKNASLRTGSDWLSCWLAQLVSMFSQCHEKYSSSGSLRILSRREAIFVKTTK